MMNQVNQEVTVDSVHVICDACVREAKVHRVSRKHGLEYLVRVECHGVHRLVSLPHYVTRVAELTTPGRVTVLWSQLPDAFPDRRLRDHLNEHIASVKYARRQMAEPDFAPGDAADWNAAIHHLESVCEDIKIVMRNRAGEMVGDGHTLANRVRFFVCPGKRVSVRPPLIRVDPQDEP